MTTRAFLARLLLFAVAVIGVQAAIGTAGLSEELVRFREALDERVDVLFFCDSTDRAHDPTDTDRRAVHELLTERLDGDLSLASIDHAAYHTLVYRDYVDAMLAQEHRPELVVFALNTRSFLPGWTRRPGWQFERLRFTLRHPWGGLFWQPLAVLKWADSATITDQAFRASEVVLDGQPAGTVGDYLRGGDPEALDTPELLAEDLALRLTVNDLGTIRADDERVVALREAIERCVAAGVDVVAYVTPVDVAAGETYLPGRFRDSVVRNAATLVRAVDDAGGRGLDGALLGQAFEERTGQSMFSWQRIPNEHLDQAGRLELAAFVAEGVNAWLARER